MASAAVALDGLGLSLQVDAATGAVSVVRTRPLPGAAAAVATPVALPGGTVGVAMPEAGAGTSVFLMYAAVGFCATLGCLLVALAGCTAARAVRAGRSRAEAAADVEAAAAAAPPPRPPTKPSFLVIHPGDGAACVAVASSPDAGARRVADAGVGGETPPAAKAARPRRPLSGLIPAVRALAVGPRPGSAMTREGAAAAGSPARRPDADADV